MPRKATVLVVDDDPAILAYYRKLFVPERDDLDILSTGAERGYRAEEGDEGSLELRTFSLPSEMIAAFSAEREAGGPIPLCILDMRMPEQNGLSAALALRAIDPGVAIVICTAYSDASADTLSEKLGDRIFLVQKPFSADAFRLLVHSLVREWQGRRRLAANEERLRRIIEATRVGTWEWNSATGEFRVSEQLDGILGLEAAGAGTRELEDYRRRLHPEDAQAVGRVLERHSAGEDEYIDFECRLERSGGDWVWVQCRGKAIKRDAAGRPLLVYGTIGDISERKAMEERMREMAIRDPLTEIYNRRYVFDRVAALCAEYSRDGRGFSLAIMDIDHFKAINDEYGHQAGDMVLSSFASAIAGRIRPYDILGRYGGEEFILVSPGGRSPEIRALVERIRVLVEGMAFAYEGREIRFTFSAGVADSSELPREGFRAEALVDLADKRLYLAKEGGRNRVVGIEAAASMQAP